MNNSVYDKDGNVIGRIINHKVVMDSTVDHALAGSGSNCKWEHKDAMSVWTNNSNTPVLDSLTIDNIQEKPKNRLHRQKSLTEMFGVIRPRIS